MTPATILLVPSDGDPHGLLADGVCGARPPILDGWACNDARHGLWWTFGRDLNPPICDVCSARKRWEEARALVLAYQGKPVPEGCDRAYRVYYPLFYANRPHVEQVPPESWHIYCSYLFEQIHALARDWLAPELGARLVLLDADGREVTP